MSENALPCIVCEKPLKNVFSEESENHPSEGTTFTSEGHYGSTAWDPMDGQYIEINICDECLVKKADAVYQGRNRKPVMWRGMIVGWTKAIRRLVPWNPDAGGDFEDDVLEVDQDDLENPEQVPEVEWLHPPKVFLEWRTWLT